MNIFKIIVCGTIIFLTGYIGYLKSKKLKDREYILREMVTFLNLVENEIKYMMNMLPNAYEISRQKLNTKLKDAIGEIVVELLAVNSPTLIDQFIVEKISKIDGLTQYDKSVFASTLKNLGRTDIEGQLNIIQNGITIIENQIKEANEFKLKNSKLYKTIGVITGLMLVIIII